MDMQQSILATLKTFHPSALATWLVARGIVLTADDHHALRAADLRIRIAETGETIAVYAQQLATMGAGGFGSDVLRIEQARRRAVEVRDRLCADLRRHLEER
jgi:hypothetical protein